MIIQLGYNIYYFAESLGICCLNEVKSLGIAQKF